MTKEKLIIIGAGPSGLTTAKAAIENGISPLIIEKNSSLGGVWSITNGKTWDSLKTNISKFNCMFSDYEWPKTMEEFPNTSQVYSYLNSYSREYLVHDKILFKHEVIEVNKNDGDLWVITVKDPQGKHFILKAEYIVISTGFFQEKNLPKHLGSLDGKFIHSSDYENPERYKGKNICVIGGSFSGFEIANELSFFCNKLDHYVTRKVHILPRYIKVDSLNKQIPIDIFLYSRSEIKDNLNSEDSEFRRTNSFLNSISSNKFINLPFFFSEKDYNNPPFVVISDDYICNVAESKINTFYCENGFNDIKFRNYDYIIICTGYKCSLNFMQKEVKLDVKFCKEDLLQPLILNHSIFPSFDNLAFVGMYKGPYFGIIELQARLVIQKLLNAVSYSSSERLGNIKKEMNIRENCPRHQFPHGDYVNFADTYAHKLGVYPKSCIDLKNHVEKGPVIPSHYRLTGPNAKPQLAKKIIYEVEKLYPVSERIFYA